MIPWGPRSAGVPSVRSVLPIGVTGIFHPMRTTAIERRAQVLEAAAKLFAERGFHGVSLDDIGRSVGISGPALYRHFASKDDILGAVLVSISQHLLDGAVEIERRIADPTERLRAFVDWHVDFAVTQPELIIVHGREFADLRGEERRTVRRLQRTYVDLWAAQVMRRDARLTIPHAGAIAIAAFGLMNTTPFSVSRLEPDEVRQLLTRLARGVLGV